MYIVGRKILVSPLRIYSNIILIGWRRGCAEVDIFHCERSFFIYQQLSLLLSQVYTLFKLAKLHYIIGVWYSIIYRKNMASSRTQQSTDLPTNHIRSSTIQKICYTRCGKIIGTSFHSLIT